MTTILYHMECKHSENIYTILCSQLTINKPNLQNNNNIKVIKKAASKAKICIYIYMYNACTCARTHTHIHARVCICT